MTSCPGILANMNDGLTENCSPSPLEAKPEATGNTNQNEDKTNRDPGVEGTETDQVFKTA